MPTHKINYSDGKFRVVNVNKLPNKTTLQSLDRVYLGQPFVNTVSKFQDTRGLDTVYLGQPFYGHTDAIAIPSSRISTTNHPDVNNWLNTVALNGGSASSSTIAALNIFCNNIDAAGLRNKFYRLNLFCGNNLNSCLVPLYTGPSAISIVFGSSIDTNINFINSDYNETGSSGGLKGNGSNKYLQTTIASSAWVSLNLGSHLSVYKTTSVNNGVLISSRLQGSDANLSQIWEFGAGGNGAGGNTGAFGSPGTHNSLLGTTRESNAQSAIVKSFRNTEFSADNSGGNNTSPTMLPFTIFARNSATIDTNTYSINLYSNQTLASYSMGLHLTNTDIIAYNTVMQTFQTALNRNV
jgi:hypothetical protein